MPNIPKKEDIGVTHLFQLRETTDPIFTQYPNEARREAAELNAIEGIAVHGETRAAASNDDDYTVYKHGRKERYRTELASTPAPQMSGRG